MHVVAAVSTLTALRAPGAVQLGVWLGSGVIVGRSMSLPGHFVLMDVLESTCAIVERLAVCCMPDGDSREGLAEAILDVCYGRWVDRGMDGRNYVVAILDAEDWGGIVTDYADCRPEECLTALIDALEPEPEVDDGQ